MNPRDIAARKNFPLFCPQCLWGYKRTDDLVDFHERLRTLVRQRFRFADEDINIQSGLRFAKEFIDFVDPLVRQVPDFFVNAEVAETWAG